MMMIKLRQNDLLRTYLYLALRKIFSLKEQKSFTFHELGLLENVVFIII